MRDVTEFIEKIHDLPNIPKVIQELIESFNHDDMDSSELAKKISHDQILSLKILRMANSTFYGHSRKISDINDAVITLGFNTLRNLVLTTGVTGAFRSTKVFDIKVYWRKSFKTAALAKELAYEHKKSSSTHCNIEPETAFTCGMLHNVGAILLHLHAPKIIQQIEEETPSEVMRINAQVQSMGISYPQIGAELCRRWRLPETICSAILEQEACDDISIYAQIICLAKLLISHENRPFNEEEVTEIFPDHINDALKKEAVLLLKRIEIKSLGREFEMLL